MENQEDATNYSELIEKYRWMVRPCKDYKAEADECQRLQSRFHQYFIHGTFTDCSTWLRDVQNCESCISEKNYSACREIIANERARRLERHKAHANNDVWEKREKPPDNWNGELPDWWWQEHKNSAFLHFSQEVKEYMETNEPQKPYTSCVIL